MKLNRLFVLTFCTVVAGLMWPAAAHADLTLNKGDHISLVGSALGDRLQHDNWLEISVTDYTRNELFVDRYPLPLVRYGLKLLSMGFFVVILNNRDTPDDSSAWIGRARQKLRERDSCFAEQRRIDPVVHEWSAQRHLAACITRGRGEGRKVTREHCCCRNES